MDPVTLGLGAGLAALVSLLAYLLFRKPKQLPAPEQKPPPKEEEKRKEPQVPPPPPPPPPPKLSMGAIIEQVVDLLAVTQKKVLVGWKHVSDQVVGETIEERPYPGDILDVRPIQNVSELPMLLPSERTTSPELQMIRLVAGESLVMSHLHRDLKTEPVNEPVYDAVDKVVYVLLDVSPSMFGNDGSGRSEHSSWWMIPYWRGIVISLLKRAIGQNATFILRVFGGRVEDSKIATDPVSADKLEKYVRTVGSISSTNIGLALRTAIDDFAKMRDASGSIEGEFMIVTDGENTVQYNHQALRRQMDDMHIKLHSILLGTQNSDLRAISDVYQELPEAGVLNPVVRRKK